jgi:uncharacterized protein (TIGR00288 family)
MNSNQNTNKRVVLLVDADNVSPDVIEQAVEAVMTEHGAIHVRRAYCTAESALKDLALFKRLAIRPMVNLSAGKNSTDIALAIDAIDLVIAERPEVVVIVSSDSDFAPLVIRLREKGCRVEGIGQDGKTGDETIAVYDTFTVLSHRRARAAPAAAKAARAAPAGAQGGESGCRACASTRARVAPGRRAAHPECGARAEGGLAAAAWHRCRAPARCRAAGQECRVDPLVQEIPAVLRALARRSTQQSAVSRGEPIIALVKRARPPPVRDPKGCTGGRSGLHRAV